MEKAQAYIDKHKAMSLIVSALYFPKQGDKAKPYQAKLGEIMNYESLLFSPLPGEDAFDYFP